MPSFSSTFTIVKRTRNRYVGYVDGRVIIVSHNKNIVRDYLLWLGYKDR